MRRWTRAAVIGTTVCLVGAAAAAQHTPIKMGGGGSPHERLDATVDGAKISIEYGRPYVKGRQIFGSLVPFGKPWRTGADEATTLVTDKALQFGSLSVPAGTYTLWTIPGEKQWKLVVNKQTGQWGTAYDEAQDLGRVDMKVEAMPAAVEQLTLSIGDTPDGGVLGIEWDKTKATVPFTVTK
jgi:hypothetical protein